MSDGGEDGIGGVASAAFEIAASEMTFRLEVADLEIGVIDPALAHAFVGQPVNLLEQQQPDRKPRRYPRPALVAVERGDLAVGKVPVDLAGRLLNGLETVHGRL